MSEAIADDQTGRDPVADRTLSDHINRLIPPLPVSKRVRTRREGMGWTIEEAAVRSKVPVEGWVAIEAGAMLHTDHNIMIAVALQWHPDTLNNLLKGGSIPYLPFIPPDGSGSADDAETVRLFLGLPAGIKREIASRIVAAAAS